MEYRAGKMPGFGNPGASLRRLLPLRRRVRCWSSGVELLMAHGILFAGGNGAGGAIAKECRVGKTRQAQRPETSRDERVVAGGSAG